MNRISLILLYCVVVLLKMHQRNPDSKDSESSEYVDFKIAEWMIG
jgi:hypothetical protein